MSNEVLAKMDKMVQNSDQEVVLQLHFGQPSEIKHFSHYSQNDTKLTDMFQEEKKTIYLIIIFFLNTKQCLN